MSEGLEIWGGGTVLPNGVKVAVWDLSQIFKKEKKMFLHIMYSKALRCTFLGEWKKLVQLKNVLLKVSAI